MAAAKGIKALAWRNHCVAGSNLWRELLDQPRKVAFSPVLHIIYVKEGVKVSKAHYIEYHFYSLGREHPALLSKCEKSAESIVLISKKTYFSPGMSLFWFRPAVGEGRGERVEKSKSN